MANIRTLPSGKHQVRWRDSRGEEQCRAFPADRRRDAARFKVEVESLRARGEDWRERDTAPVADLEQMMQAFVEHQALVRGLAASTGQQLVVGLELFRRFLRLSHPRGSLWPDLLDREHVAAFFVWMQTSREWQGRRGMTRLTAFQHARKVLRFWRWAHDHDTFSEWVARPRDVELAEARPVLRPYAPTWRDCDAAIAMIRLEWQRRLWVACRFTGLRRGQVMALTWADVDLDAAMLTVRPELGKSRQERTGRLVPLSPHLVAEMAGWGVREGHLIETTGEKRRIDYGAFRRAWSEATGRPMRQPFHAFRRAFMTGLREAGVALDVIQYLVGHRRGTAGDVYMSAAAVMGEARRAIGLLPPVGSVAPDAFAGRREGGR